MTARVSQVLSEAADLLEKPGAWTQDKFRDNHNSCFCAVGAIGMVLGKGRWPGPSAAVGWVDRYWPIAGEKAIDVEDFNDTPGRQQIEVVAMMRRAAALAKEQGR